MQTLSSLKNAVERIFSCKISFWYSRERARQKFAKFSKNAFSKKGRRKLCAHGYRPTPRPGETHRSKDVARPAHVEAQVPCEVQRPERCVRGRRRRQPVDAAKPQKRYVPKRAEPAAAAPVRRRRDSAGDPGTQKAKKPKGKAACKKKAKPE